MTTENLVFFPREEIQFFPGKSISIFKHPLHQTGASVRSYQTLFLTYDLANIGSDHLL